MRDTRRTHTHADIQVDQPHRHAALQRGRVQLGDQGGRGVCGSARRMEHAAALCTSHNRHSFKGRLPRIPGFLHGLGCIHATRAAGSVFGFVPLARLSALRHQSSLPIVGISLSSNHPGLYGKHLPQTLPCACASATTDRFSACACFHTLCKDVIPAYESHKLIVVYTRRNFRSRYRGLKKP